PIFQLARVAAARASTLANSAWAALAARSAAHNSALASATLAGSVLVESLFAAVSFSLVVACAASALATDFFAVSSQASITHGRRSGCHASLGSETGSITSGPSDNKPGTPGAMTVDL